MISLHVLLWNLVLPQLINAPNSEDTQCRLDVADLEGITQTGDVMIGIVLPFHLFYEYKLNTFTKRPPRSTCSKFSFEYFQQLQAMLFAIDEITKSPTILPNITLGFQVYDSCLVIQQSLEGVLHSLTGNGMAIPNYRCLQGVPLSAVISHPSSTHSVLLAQVLGLFRYPQISHFATSPLLSDRKRFPSFFRNVPSDASQARGIAQLLLHFGWTWVGLLGLDDDYGQQGIQLVKKEVTQAGACVAFTENIVSNQPDLNAPHIVNVIKKSTAMVVVVFSQDIEFAVVLAEMVRQNVTRRIFVASETWSTSTLFSMGTLQQFVSGTIGLALHGGIIMGFKEFLTKVHPSSPWGGKWVKILWEKTFNCTLMDNSNVTSVPSTSIKLCTGEESLERVQNSFTDVSNLRVTYNAYIAVQIVARALEDLRSCSNNDKCASVSSFYPWQLLPYMKRVRMKLSSGMELYFDKNEDPPAVYDIVNWYLSQEGTIHHFKVGSYDTTATPGQVFRVNTSIIQWPTGEQQVPQSVCSESCPPGFRKAPRSGQPVCCFQCVPCPQGEISNQSDSVDCLKCPWDQWPNPQKSMCLPKTIEYLSYEDPLGVTLAVAAIVSSLFPNVILRLFVLQRNSPIVKASNYSLSCLLLLSLSLCFFCSLAFIGPPQRGTCLLRQSAFGMIFTFCVSCILAKTIMVVFAFMATKPGSTLRIWTSPWVSFLIIFICSLLQFILCISWVSLARPFPELSSRSQSRLISFQCNEGSTIAFWAMLGYLSLLAFISFIVAFLARRLPDSFNEAQYITFSMVAFLSVWISFIPAYLSAQGKYTVAMEIFAILSSSWALLICMFFPKCFIILFRPDMNSREYLMRKGKTPSK
ncbi:PREDICTED: extracellular calcium-sensing receptor-like [Nanorana parkeri]|uniref:extracellular calcium-sensing receptor-like n=1 Tax=Nanorana parkeri TaxID=125878 RepID=UPI00085464F4|nr:PREDICTED: extracellular calcium-sensing receptor-like [Nanorana parkeri]